MKLRLFADRPVTTSVALQHLLIHPITRWTAQRDISCVSASSQTVATSVLLESKHSTAHCRARPLTATEPETPSSCCISPLGGDWQAKLVSWKWVGVCRHVDIAARSCRPRHGARPPRKRKSFCYRLATARKPICAHQTTV